MDWLAVIAESSLDTLLWVAGLAIAFSILAYLMPCNPGRFWWTDLYAAGTDLLYWFVTPLFMRVFRTFCIGAAITWLFGSATPGFTAIQQLPIALQSAAILVLQDILLYWIHRGFHGKLGWRFHAVHHSPATVDWFSAGRNHIVNTLLSFTLADVVVQLLGFSPAAIYILTPINIIYSSMVHANLNWTFGPLRYVFASPVFHRWHHTSESGGIDRNFAPTFPILDVIFGTFYMPPGKFPEHFGNGEHDFPEDFWGQLVHPFRSKNAEKPLGERPSGKKSIPTISHSLAHSANK